MGTVLFNSHRLFQKWCVFEGKPLSPPYCGSHSGSCHLDNLQLLRCDCPSEHMDQRKQGTLFHPQVLEVMWACNHKENGWVSFRNPRTREEQINQGLINFCSSTVEFLPQGTLFLNKLSNVTGKIALVMLGPGSCLFSPDHSVAESDPGWTASLSCTCYQP